MVRGAVRPGPLTARGGAPSPGIRPRWPIVTGWTRTPCRAGPQWPSCFVSQLMARVNERRTIPPSVSGSGVVRSSKWEDSGSRRVCPFAQVVVPYGRVSSIQKRLNSVGSADSARWTES